MGRRLIVLVAVAIAAAGCGGHSASPPKPVGPPLTKAQYQAKLKEIAKDVSTKFASSGSTKEISKADVDSFVAAIHAFTSRLALVNPPAEVKTLHTRLIGAMNDFADEFPGMADKLNKAQASKDANAAIAAIFGSKAFQELGTLQTAFKAKGYDLNLNG